jgi:hypothetical protein
MRDAIWYWPECPDLPPPGRFVLICVRSGTPRAEARLKLRAVLRQILAAWTQISPEQLPLKETTRGPAWESRLRGDLLETSIQSDAPFPLTPALSPREKEFLLSGRACSPAGKHFPARSTILPAPEPGCDQNGPLSLSLSPSEGERVPKAGEGAVQGRKARIRSGDSLPEGEGLVEGEQEAQVITGGLDLSLSYAEGEAWIALSRGGLIGVDVLRLEPVPEAEAIAQTYFGPADRSALRQSAHPVRDFAVAWTQLEARCKCLKQGLTEWSEASATQVQGCSTDSVIVEDRLALSVATAPQDFLCRRNA